MLKRILILPFILILFGCGAVSQQYKTEEFSLDIPKGWIIESRQDRIPQDVSVVFFKRDIDPEKYYSLNLIEEKLPESTSAKDFYDKSVEMASSFENFEQVSEDKYSFDGVSGIIHVFNSFSADSKTNQTVVQAYIFAEQLMKGYTLTGVLDRDDDLALQNTLDLIKSFSLIQLEDSSE